MPNDTIETTDTVAARAVADQIATDVTTVVDARVDERLAAHETQLAAREDALVERLVERLAPPAATTAGDPPPRVEVTLDAGDRPFRSLGEQLQAVATASTPGVELDPAPGADSGGSEWPQHRRRCGRWIPGANSVCAGPARSGPRGLDAVRLVSAP